jgi:hypothetical protein
MTTCELLAGFWDTVLPMPKLQIPLAIVLIAIIVGWIMYRRKQM